MRTGSRERFSLAILMMCVGPLSAAVPDRATSKGAPSAAVNLLPPGPAEAASAPAIPGLSAKYDFGTVFVPGVTTLEHVFALRNQSVSNVIIAGLVTSCGCTTAVVGAEGGSLPVMLGPSKELSIQVRMSVDYATGAKSETVLLEGTGDHPITLGSLEVSANSVAAVTVRPRELDFGVLRLGEQRSMLVNMTVDSRATGLVGRLRLISNSPWIVVKSDDGSHQASPRAGTGEGVYSITATPDKHIGDLSGTLTIASDLPGASLNVPSTEVVRLESLLRGMAVPVRAVVRGRLSASSDVSVVVPGDSEGATVLVCSDSRELLARSHVRCDSPWVTASIGSVSKRSPKPPPADRPPDSAAVAMGELLWEAPLRVRVSVNAPPGLLDAAVLVDAPDGESLRIPVLAYAR